MSTVDRVLSWSPPTLHGRVPWLLLTVLPVLVLYALVALLPMTFAAYASLHDIALLDPNWTFVGLRNYAVLLGMDAFWASLWRGIVYAVGSTVIHLVVGVWMALALHHLRNRLLTAIVFTAYLTPMVVLALLTLFLFDVWAGAFHVVGAEWLGLWNPRQYALGRGGLALAIVVLAGS